MRTRYVLPFLVLLPVACASPAGSNVFSGSGAGASGSGTGGSGGRLVGGGSGGSSADPSGGTGGGAHGVAGSGGGSSVGGSGTSGAGGNGGSSVGGSGGSSVGGSSGGVSGIECSACTTDAQCGDGQTAGCWLGDANGNPAFCATDCTTGQACAPGSSCVQDSGDPYMTCVPDVGSCSGGSGGAGGGTGSVQCSPCTTDATCGDGQTAGCWLPDANGNPGFCALDCTNGNSCPSGSTCVQDSSDPYSTCVPTSGTCSGGSTGGSGGSTGGSGGSTGGSGGGGSTCTDTWANYGQSFFSSHCSSCHSWATSHTSVKSKVGSIVSRIQGGSMPPGGLSASDKQRVLNYLNCGAP